ncbi:MAG: TonB-dependent receptor [Paludibacteraceae bacterium]|nr:TonB-dependent receptor [Paludibacteraceae bacterium]
MKHLLYTLTILFLSFSLFANTNKSDANLVGHVLDAATGEHLPFVTIQLANTSIGTVSDASGHFFLTNLPPGETTFIFSMVGYTPIEASLLLHEGMTSEINIALEEESLLIDQVVVTANKYETKKREATTIVNVISPLLIESTASNTMSDVLDFQTGVRVEMSCQNCGVPQLRINGLEGQYTQLMMDSRPIFSSLASVYGLEQVPAGMVDRVEVMRGGGSALYGSNAIGGVVNIITKEPVRNSLNISQNSQIVGGKAWDNNTNLNGSFVTSDSKIGVFLFGVLRQREAYDHDDDGFSEIPRLNSSTLGFRSYFKTSDYSKLTLEYHHVTEARRGGNMLDRPEHEADIAESLRHNIDAGNLRWDYYSPDERHYATAYSSLQHIGRNSYFGTAQDLNAYGASDDIAAVVGGQYRFHMYNCLFMPADLSAGVEYSYNRLRDVIMGYGRDLRQNVHLYGGYVQNEWKNKDVSFLIGLRGEKHSMLKRPIFSPRANVRYTPIKEIVLRATYASGYRAPQTYDEDLHVGAVGGEVSLIQLDPNLRPEMSHSVSASADWARRFGSWESNVTLEGFFTQLNDVFSLIENGHDALGNLLLLRTNEKGARVYGMNLEGKVAYKSKFIFQLGYTYQQSRYIEAVTWSENENIAPQKRMFRTPDHYGYFMATYEPIRKFTINLNGKLTGPMLIQHFAGYVAEDEEVVSPTFFDMGIKLAYEIPLYRLYSLEINAGVKNIFNSFQRDIDQGIDRDAGYIYGPSLPRTYFFGLNFKL